MLCFFVSSPPALYVAVGNQSLLQILNIFWAFFVLEIVPQTNEDAARLGTWISLEEAEENGQISTVPIIEIIELRFPQFHWISLTVTFFIVLSITVR